MQSLAEWRERILPVIDTLKRAGGTTEDEFLQIGACLQDFYVKSRENSRLANQLVGLLGDDDYHAMIGALQLMIDEINKYLCAARSRSTESLDTLGRVLELLDAASGPLEGFQKMHKALRMLGISTKIESARLGELGNGFTVLAMDVEKLSFLVNEKANAILVQQLQLEQIIVHNLQVGKSNDLLQDAELSAMLRMAMTSFEGLTELNNRCSGCGQVAGNVADEVAASISEVVSSMQTHDIMRQQMEHVTEALDRLTEELGDAVGMDEGNEAFLGYVSQTGDVCELQVAQVRFAVEGLHNAVVTILHNLQDIGTKQSLLAKEVMNATGADGTSERSYFDDLRKGVAGAGTVLINCAELDRKLFMALEKVAETIEGISGFVGAIEEIGAEIDLLALNAQIKAAHTGQDGVALGVLAEAIKRLSLQAATHADALSKILTTINNITGNLVSKARREQTSLYERVMEMEGKVDGIISSIERINVTSSALFTDLVNNVGTLNQEIKQATSNISVHNIIGNLTNQVAVELEEIVAQARSLMPATNDFYNNLRHMTDRYTMQSERLIHEEIARIHSGETHVSVLLPLVVSETCAESEFGENVDLF